jgi:hypothetical protein
VAQEIRLWAITSYFNPIGYRSRLENYKTFRDRLDVPLLTVEWSVDGRFELGSRDAEVLVQLSSPHLMWQKERLLNLGLRQLPRSAEAVAWLDCDIVFRRGDWAQVASCELERFPVAQLFSQCFFPRPGPAADGSEKAVASLVHLSRQPGSEADRFRRLWGRSAWSKPKRHRITGAAWVARHDLLDRFGLYDACVFGGGDRAFAGAVFGAHRRAREAWMRTSEQKRHYLQWADPVAEAVGGRVGLVEGDLVHLWHGEVENRQYRVRHRLAASHAFDPFEDLETDPETGLWRWASPKAELHRALAEFFSNRREDTVAR